MLSWELAKLFHTIFTLYILSLLPLLLTEYIVDIEKPDRISSVTFDGNEFSGLLLHPSFYSAIHSRSP